MSIWTHPPCEGARFYGFFDDEGVIVSATLYSAYRYKSDLATKTVSRYCQAITLFMKYLDETASEYSSFTTSDDRLVHATRLDVDNFLTSRKDEGICRSTRTVDEIAIRNFYEWLSTEEGGQRVTNHPFSKKWKLTTLKPHRKLKYGLLTEQFIELLKGLYNECERAFFHFAFDVGARISTLAMLPKASIDDALNYSNDCNKRCKRPPRYVPIVIPLTKKGGREIINHPCLVALPTLYRIAEYHKTDEYQYSPYWDYNDPNKPAFLTTNGKKWTRGNARRSMNAAAIRAGIILPNALLPTPHTLRHSSAYSILTCADHGADGVERLVSAMSQLGHTSLSSTQIYTRLPITLQNSNETTVYDRAAKIYSETFLPPRLHKERRGHKPAK